MISFAFSVILILAGVALATWLLWLVTEWLARRRCD